MGGGGNWINARTARARNVAVYAKWRARREGALIHMDVAASKFSVFCNAMDRTYVLAFKTRCNSNVPDCDCIDCTDATRARPASLARRDVCARNSEPPDKVVSCG